MLILNGSTSDKSCMINTYVMYKTREELIEKKFNNKAY